MNKNLSNLIYAVLAVLILIFSVVCLFFIPNFALYLDELLAERGTVIPHIRAIVYICGALLAAPCLSILVMGFRLNLAVASDTVFTRTTADIVVRISRILCFDCVFFIFGIIALFIIGEGVVSYLFAFIDMVGIAIAFLLRVLSDYIRRAALLKEEADCTL